MNTGKDIDIIIPLKQIDTQATGLNPYDRNVYGRSDELIQKVRSIKKLANAINSRNGVLDIVDNYYISSAGITSGKNYLIQINPGIFNNITLLGYGYTLTHEMIHAFDLQFNMSDWEKKYGSSGFRRRDLQAFREKRAYDYNIRTGMKLEGAQIDAYNNFKEIIKNSRNLKNNISNFKIINPWR